MLLQDYNFAMTEGNSSLVPARYQNAQTFLRYVLALVMMYALDMVLSGRTFAMTLFEDLLNFGPVWHGLKRH
jgi:hypothetical protein